MSGTTVTVKPEIIRWILQTIQSDNIASSSIELLNKWQSGEKVPTFNQVEDMSKKTCIPFGYFFLDKPPAEECPIVDYRTVNSLAVPEPSRNLMDTLDSMTEIQDWMVDYVIENGQEELDYVGSAAGQNDIKLIASDIRVKLEIKKEWYTHCSSAADSFKYLKSLMDKLGILIMMNGIVGNNTRRKLNVDEFRAFTLVNKYVPLIFINTCDSDTGKLFSLLHEIAHIWRGVNSFYNNQMGTEPDSAEEKICNAVAAEILVPEDIFTNQWEISVGTNFEKIDVLFRYFKCSRFVIARKARDCNKISQTTYGEIVSTLTNRYKKWRDSQNEGSGSGGDYYRTLSSKLDHRLVTALANSAKEGRTQYTEVFRLTNTNRKTFSKLLLDIGGAG